MSQYISRKVDVQDGKQIHEETCWRLQQNLTGACCDKQSFSFGDDSLCFIDSIVKENEDYLGEEGISTSCDIT